MMPHEKNKETSIPFISTNDDRKDWNKEKKQLLALLNADSPEPKHKIQIVAHPSEHDSIHCLKNNEQLGEQILSSIRTRVGWSFPCHNSQLTDKENYTLPFSSDPAAGIESSCIFSLSGLIIYNEDLGKSAYVTIHDRPLNIYRILGATYKALDFFGRYFKYIPANHVLKIGLSLSDTSNRLPIAQESIAQGSKVFNNLERITTPIICTETALMRSEITTNLEEAFFKIAREIFNEMGQSIPEDQLKSEIEKVVRLLTKKN